MVGTGFATTIIWSNIIVFQRSAAAHLDYLSKLRHPCYIAVLLVVLITLHMLAAFYHQFVRGDGLFQRILFGRRA